VGLKKYIIGSLLLIAGIFTYIYNIINAGNYTLELFGTSVVLPIALWIVVPTFVLVVMSVLHIVFYGLKNYFSLKAINKDSESIFTLLSKKLTNQTSSRGFQNKNFKDIGDALDQLDITVTNSNFRSTNKQLNTTVEQVLAINGGKYISTKELKLDNKNPLMVKNLINRISQDENFALDVVKSPKTYTQDVVKSAFSKVLDSKSITTIKNIIEDLTLDEDMLISLLKKDSEQKPEFAMNNTLLLKLIKKVNLTNQQLIDIAKTYKSTMTPDQIIHLYEDISGYNEEYNTAYLYVLAEYEMIDKMRDILENSASYEYIPFKALVDLKDAGKNIYSIDTLSYK